jgi:hypothetical protein
MFGIQNKELQLEAQVVEKQCGVVQAFLDSQI